MKTLPLSTIQRKDTLSAKKEKKKRKGKRNRNAVLITLYRIKPLFKGCVFVLFYFDIKDSDTFR